MKIHYKFEKQNTVSDILSRLSHQEAETEVNEEFILDILFIKSIYIFHMLITKISDKFKILFREDYECDA